MSETIETTETVKKSILTSAMEKVAAKKAANESPETTPTAEEIAAKRALKKTGIALVGTVAAIAAVNFVMNRLEKKNSETVEETDTQD